MSTNSMIPRLIALAAGLALLAYVAHLRGQIADLENRLAAAPEAAPPGEEKAAPPVETNADSPPPSGDGRSLAPWQRNAILDVLWSGGDYAGSPVWFQTVPDNAEAASFQKELQSVFEDAEWKVQDNSPVSFAMKPGLYVFAADDEPPLYVGAVSAALEAASLPLASVGRGYRAYYEERKAANPGWVGFPMAADQTFVIVIGREPEDAS